MIITFRMKSKYRTKRGSSSDPDFQELVRDLDRYLTITDGDEHDFYHQYNGIENIPYVVVIYDHKEPVACGSLRPMSEEMAEIKRMYVKPSRRRRGLASMVIRELEEWARELGLTSLVLETGKRQTEATSFYPAMGYRLIPNYGPYEGVENSLCYQKDL